jgi:hypothetical protein
MVVQDPAFPCATPEKIIRAARARENGLKPLSLREGTRPNMIRRPRREARTKARVKIGADRTAHELFLDIPLTRPPPLSFKEITIMPVIRNYFGV